MRRRPHPVRRPVRRPALAMALLAGNAFGAPPDTAATAIADASAPADGEANAPSRTTAEDIVVVGHRQAESGGGLIKPEDAPKSVSTVSQAYIGTQSSIQNAYQYVQLTPGAAVGMSDPYGLSEQFTINVRGLGQDELGYVLEGMPLNDIGFYTAYPSQFIDSENIDEISLAQGSADLDSPVISAAGGLLNLSMLDPSVDPGGSVDASYGSYHANREFVRLDSGLIGDSGIRAFVSYSHTAADNYRGPGRDHRQHIDYKVVREWGDGNRIALTGTYHDGITTYYPQPTLDQFRQFGRSFNLDGTYTPGDANFWGLHVGTFRLLYMSMPSKFALSDALTLNLTPYWQYGYGNSPFGSTLNETGNYQGTQGPYTVYIPNAINGVAAVQANYQDQQYRAGLVSKLNLRLDNHTITIGYWFDYADETDTQSYSAISNRGFPGDIWADTDAGLLRLPDGRKLLAGADHVITQVSEVFLADTIKLLDERLVVQVGFKEAIVNREGTNNVPGPQYRATVNSSEPLPRAAARFQIDEINQVFGSVTTNFRTPSEATLFDAYAGGALYGQANTNLKTEYSISEEVGYRYSGPLVTASATFFNYNFTNRQVATLVGGNLINESINAGGQTTRGIDVEAGTRPWHYFSPYVSGEFLNSTIDNDIEVGADYLRTTGKTSVRSPRYQAGLGLTYDDGTFFGNVGVKFIDSEYATFSNDEKIPSHTTADLSVGYRFPEIGLKAPPELKVNFVNISDDNYLSGVATPTTNSRPAVGKFGTAIAGTPPTYYIAGGFAVIATLKQAF